MSNSKSEEVCDRARRLIYKVLDPKRNEIRILELLPSPNRNQPLSCNLRTVSLDDQPKYDALSWCWGDQTQSATIEVNKIPLRCSANLATALPYFRDVKDVKILWVDALCINQKSLSEKSVSIPLLSRVYKQAQTVRIWLGEAANGSDDGVEVMRRLQISPRLTKLKINGALLTEQHLRSFIALLNRPWFERIWVMQEIALSTRAVFYCGDDQFTSEKLVSITYDMTADVMADLAKPFHSVSDVESAIRSREFFDALQRLGRIVHVLETIQDGHQYSEWHATKMLCALSKLSASDPRDKVYGCLAMLPGFSELINPTIDYTSPVQGVYIVATFFLFCHTQYLYPLCYTRSQFEESMPGLPSWCMDFSHDVNKSYTLFENFSATANSKPWISPRLEFRLLWILWVRGTFLDEIVSRHHVVPDVQLQASRSWNLINSQKDLHGVWRTYFGLEVDTYSHAAYSGGGSLENAYWRTVVCDLCPQDNDYKFIQRLKWVDVQPFVDWIQKPTCRVIDENSTEWDGMQSAPTYLMALHRSMGNQNAYLFRTKRGFIGTSVGHPEIRVGDHLYFLDGGNVPMALRPVQHNNQTVAFEFASECYVHGVMDGEAFRAAPQPSSKQWKRHELRRKLFGGSPLDTEFPVSDWKDIALV